MSKGKLFVVSGPSGVGKGTVCNGILERVENLKVSVSATTRLPRPGDVEGVTYFFKSQEQFANMIKNGEFLEWAEYNGNRYGTPVSAVNDMLERGISVILEIDTQGALQVKAKMSAQPNFKGAILIFIAPSSFEELKARLKGRATESDEEISRRIAAAEGEMALQSEYDYVVINDDLNKAIEETEKIIKEEKRQND